MEKNDAREPKHHALGRSRGGFSTKVHLVCDGAGVPLNLELSPGHRHETQLFEALWESTEVSDHRLRHLIQPLAVAGDKAYRSAKIIEQLTEEGVQSVIPQKGKKANDQDNPGFDRDLYRRRNVVERLFGWLKESRRVFARSEKTAINDLGMLHVASIRYDLSQSG